MLDRSLSPFLDLPRALTFDRELVAKLEYEVSALKTEKRLLEQANKSSAARYEELLTRKAEEFALLQNNFDFVYAQRKELQLKLANQKDVAAKASEDLTQQVKDLRSENKALKTKLDKAERHLQTVSGKCEHLRVDFNRELATNDQYRERLSTLEQENSRLVLLNDNLLERVKTLTKSIESGESGKSMEDLQLRLLTLQKTKSELQAKFDLLLQLRTSVELLKQKNASLQSKIQSLEQTQIRVASLEHENNELKARFNEYFGLISSTVESKSQESEDDLVRDFVKNFRLLQNKNLAILQELQESQTNASAFELKATLLEKAIDEDYLPTIDLLKESLSGLEAQVVELLKIKTLNSREIEFLRKSLKDMDDVTSRQFTTMSPAKSDNTQERNAMNQYLSNLEKLVDEYKQEIEQLRSSSQDQRGAHVPSKRPRLLEENENKISTISQLRTQNLNLSTEVRNLNDQLKMLSEQLNAAKPLPAKASNWLELRQNPFAKDQLIKQETLDLLRRENQELIKKYIESTDVESVPKAIFARQENDKDALQAKIDEQVKKIARLNTVFANKSRDIVSIISRYFGYRIEFVPSLINPNDFCSKIKLTSKYLAQTSGRSSSYLVIDVHTKLLKANGDFEFKSMCEELVEQWVNAKNQIPCFLSALSLRIYENYASKQSEVL